jgi:hypothetical protein
MDPRIDRLAATPGVLANLVVEVSEERLDTALNGDWPVRVVLAHLRDDEYLCMRLALERLLAEDGPELRLMDGADWVANRNRTRDRKELLLADFALQRQASVTILRSLRPEDWERAGTVGGREVTVSRLVDGWVAHDAEHVAQLEAALGETYEEAVARRRRAAEG